MIEDLLEFLRKIVGEVENGAFLLAEMHDIARDALKTSSFSHFSHMSLLFFFLCSFVFIFLIYFQVISHCD
jgi:hypothetical protein